MFEEYDFGSGVIIKNDFCGSMDLSLSDDNDDLNEDMLQVEFPNGYVIDVGWYGGINSFIIFVIKDYEWEKPILKEICPNWQQLNKKIKDTVEFVIKVL